MCKIVNVNKHSVENHVTSNIRPTIETHGSDLMNVESTFQVARTPGRLAHDALKTQASLARRERVFSVCGAFYTMPPN